jgi:hypothetical protein
LIESHTLAGLKRINAVSHVIDVDKDFAAATVYFDEPEATVIVPASYGPDSHLSFL